jgi:hypothetical protein
VLVRYSPDGDKLVYPVLVALSPRIHLGHNDVTWWAALKARRSYPSRRYTRPLSAIALTPITPHAAAVLSRWLLSPLPCVSTARIYSFQEAMGVPIVPSVWCPSVHSPLWLDWATIQFRFFRPGSFNTALQLVLRPHFLVQFV